MTYQPYQPSDDVLIAQGAIVSGDVILGAGVSIWYNAVIRGDTGTITIGQDTNIQDGAVLHEPTTVGAGCTIGHNAIIHGCTIGDNCLIGMGAIVLDGAVIGNDCIVGAGAVVTGKMNAPAGSMILGSPGKIVRSLTPEEIHHTVLSKEGYLKKASIYKKEHPAL